MWLQKGILIRHRGTMWSHYQAAVSEAGYALCCRAPALFAALLRRAGVAPALLPLLAEPARAAIQGLSILARRRHPEQTACLPGFAEGDLCWSQE